jgi:hypothetical protein
MERRRADKRRCERDDFSPNRHPRCVVLLEHDHFGKTGAYPASSVGQACFRIML